MKDLAFVQIGWNTYAVPLKQAHTIQAGFVGVLKDSKEYINSSYIHFLRPVDESVQVSLPTKELIVDATVLSESQYAKYLEYVKAHAKVAGDAFVLPTPQEWLKNGGGE